LSTRFAPNLIGRKKDPRVDFVYQVRAKNLIGRKKDPLVPKIGPSKIPTDTLTLNLSLPRV
jgi:hypothetical protein